MPGSFVSRKAHREAHHVIGGDATLVGPISDRSCCAGQARCTGHLPTAT
jgi:hypothetical protein